MTNSKQYFNLEAMSALKLVEDEVAATCSGGSAYTGSGDPDVNLFSGSPDGGDSLTVNADIGDGLSYIGDGFNDKTTFVQVLRGTWVAYDNANFDQPLGTFGPGVYALGDGANRLSSIQRVG